MKRPPLKRRTPLRPKKPMERRGRSKPTAAQQDYHNQARALGCLLCGRSPQIHHIREGVLGMGQKVDHWRILPLCYDHHEGERGGDVSLHGSPALFKKLHGSELELEKKLKEELNA